jgi:diaminohydroxyphosphoribosylaminopyrimidine deaminase/5-amino-6-(5-phosphoribosylamino)uracil reductase
MKGTFSFLSASRIAPLSFALVSLLSIMHQRTPHRGGRHEESAIAPKSGRAVRQPRRLGFPSSGGTRMLAGRMAESRSATISTDVATMRLAIAEGDRARGTTGDNPWVGCVIVGAGGEVLGRGHTQGPGEDHAEIDAARDAAARGAAIEGATLYSTLEPCAFHGRTPSCARSIVARGLRRVVIGMRDPHPRVDGEGIRILERGGVQVVEGVCEADVRRQLGAWVFDAHPHEPRRRARELAPTLTRGALIALLSETYAVDLVQASALVATLGLD